LQKKFTMVRPMKKYLTAFGLINAFALVNSVFFLKRERERERETLSFTSLDVHAHARIIKYANPPRFFHYFFTKSIVFLKSKETVDRIFVVF